MKGFDWRAAGSGWLPDLGGVGLALPGALVDSPCGAQYALAIDAAGDEELVALEPAPLGAPLGRLFVYGTLMSGESRHPWLAGAVGTPARAPGQLIDMGEFPGLVPGPGEVAGELYHIDLALLEKLDQVEDFRGYGVAGSLYRRIIVTVDGAPAWTYRLIAPPAGAPAIASGDWRRRG